MGWRNRESSASRLYCKQPRRAIPDSPDCVRDFEFRKRGWLPSPQPPPQPPLQPRPRSPRLQRTRPDRHHMPPLRAELRLDPRVAGAVPLDFPPPPLPPGLGQPEIPAMFMPVPETAVDEYHGAVFGENHIRPARQGFVPRAVHGEAVTQAVEHGTHGAFRFRVAAPYPGHDIGALFRGKYISHGRRGVFTKECVRMPMEFPRTRPNDRL